MSNEQVAEAILFAMAVLVWIGLGALVGSLAEKKGHDLQSAVLLSLVLSPLIGYLYVLALPDRGGVGGATAGPPRPGKVKCPGGCAVYLRPGDRCRSCGRRLPE